jgi:DNA-binding MarR family transcriptional regulator
LSSRPDFFEQFAAIKRAITTLAGESYAELKLGTAQAKFLRHIGKNSSISQAELARATDTDAALTGRVLQTLRDRGYVKRTRSALDRREYVLELTPSGRKAQAEVERARARLFARVMASLDEKDLKDFDRIAKKILAVLE